MWAKWIKLIAAGVCLCGPAALGVSLHSRWVSRSWQTDQGLPNNNVTSLAQTSDGYLWIGNAGRLARFDGVEFETISSHHLLDHTERLSALLRSKRGGLWMALDHGPMLYLNSGSMQSFSNLPNATIRALVEDDSGSLWIAYDSTLCRIQNAHLTRLSEKDGYPDGGFCSLAVDNCGRLWLTKGGKVYLLRNGRFETLLTLANSRARLARASKGGVWLCEGFQLSHCDEHGRRNVFGSFGAPYFASAPTALLEDHAGGLWIGTSDNGLFHCANSTFEKVETSHSRISSLIEDAEGNVWVGTMGGGLDSITPRTIELEGTETGLPMEAVNSLCEDKNGILWGVTENGLLVTRRENRWRTVSNSRWADQMVNCVAADNEGAIWIGTSSQALHRWGDGEVVTFGKKEGLQVRAIHTLLASRNGDIWISGDDAQLLQQFHRGKFTNFELPCQNNSHVNALVEDAAGNLWVGTSKGGLFRVACGKLTDQTSLVKGAPRSIRALCATPDGTLWIGYAGAGLGRLKNDKIVRITCGEGLYDARISQIVADAEGWLWFGSDHGIFKIWPSVLDDVAEGRDTGFQCIHYGRDEDLPGLQTDFGYSPGAVCTRDGRVWIPTREAVAVINPTVVRENPTPPRVLLKRIAMDDETVALYGSEMPVRDAVDLQKPKTELRLPPWHHRLEFDFTALSFHASENVQFRYRLEGYDDDWVWIGTDRHATYSRLPAGKYRFTVRGCNGDGVWNETGSSFAFIVTPFLWQRWWFELGVLLLFTGMVIGIVRYVSFRRLRLKLQTVEHQAALDKERTRIARDIHDDIGSRLTNIVMLSELTLQRPATTEQATQRAGQISAAARQVMKSLDETVWAINPRNDTVKDTVDYISQYAVEFLETAHIRCRVELPDDLGERSAPAEMRHNLFLASKEALHNIVRHSRATEAKLVVSTAAETVQMIIEDNGRGFEKAPLNGLADGLRNMRQRMEEVGGHCEIESRPREGTRVLFRLPMIKK